MLVMLFAACMAQAEAPKPVAKEVAKATTLFASADSQTACAKAFIAQQQKLIAHPEWMRLSKERQEQLGLGKPQECIDAEIARLPVGVTVDVSTNPGVCAAPNIPAGSLVRVRVTSGKDKDAVGCVGPEDLRDPVPF